MKRLILSFIFIILTVTPAYAGRDLDTARDYCRRHYGKPARITRTVKPLTRRKGKPYIYVWRIVTRSRGIYGKGKAGTVAYNKRVKRGKKVVSYVVYSPHSNALDDVVAVVDNGIIRPEEI